MDPLAMMEANRGVGNPEHFPVIEFAAAGLLLEAMEETRVNVVGAFFQVNKERTSGTVLIKKGDHLKIEPPEQVYGCLALEGLISATCDFGSYATYERAGLGGIEGRGLRKNDVIQTTKGTFAHDQAHKRKIGDFANDEIRLIKGPEWHLLKEDPTEKEFLIESGDRMGIRLSGQVSLDYREMESSAVIPGIIQLPADGNPIVLMNDCQTTGGYPRIAKVCDQDLPKLAQMRKDEVVRFSLWR